MLNEASVATDVKSKVHFYGPALMAVELVGQINRIGIQSVARNRHSLRASER